MKVFTYSEARQNLAKLLIIAQKEEVEIRRRDGFAFSLTSKQKKTRSPFDVPGIITKERNWIECAEKAQTIAKTIKGKNSLCVYYERISGVIPFEKTETCLKEGCDNGLSKEEKKKYRKANTAAQ